MHKAFALRRKCRAQKRRPTAQIPGKNLRTKEPLHAENRSPSPLDADDGLSAFLGGGRPPVDASAKAAAVGFFDYNGAVSCLPDGYAAFADGFIDIGERTLYD